MHKHAMYALAHPVFYPETQITRKNFWNPDRLVSAGLTVNIGEE